VNEYRGKHAPSAPWPVASSASSPGRRGRHQRRHKGRRFLVFFLCLLLLIVLAYPFVEARILTVEKMTVRSEDLPWDANNLRIVYLSDIHWGYWYTDRDLSSLLSKINSLRPDLVLFGGDYSTDYKGALRFFRTLQGMSRIHARYGIFGVLGEADCGETAAEQTALAEAMANADVTPLINQTVPVYVGSGTVWIAGLDDFSRGNPDIKAVASPVTSSDFVILLSHNPSVIQDAQQTTDGSGGLGWFDLGLFGHTHGGQMKLFGSLLGLAEDVPSRYVSGWLVENRSSLLISRGVGMSVFPARLFCPPQIHLIEVTAD
jgi:hypothetical protein